MDPSRKSAGWTEAALDPLFRVGLVAGDARGIWASLYLAKATGEQWTVKVVQLGADGALAERYTRTVSDVVSPNYIVASLAPLTTTSAAIGGEWFLEVIGAAPRSLGNSSSYITALHGSADNDLWAGTRVGTLAHSTGGSTTSSYLLADRPSVRGLWQSTSALYLATVMGVRSVTLPLAPGWSGVTTRAVVGDFAAIAGSADDDAFAVGKDGVIAHFDGASWTTQASGTTSALGAVAARRKDDAWASSDTALLHYDGTNWSTVNEPGMPKGASSVALAADGTVWAASGGKLLRRSPGLVVGTATPAVGPVPDGGVCAFGEPNDTPYTASEVAPPFAINACAPSKDRDDYTFLPPKGTRAGFVSVTLTDTAGEHPTVSVDANLQNLPTTAYLDGVAGSAKSLFLPVPASERRYIEVSQSRTGVAVGAYALDVNYTPLDDAYEPNDSYDVAYAIASGTPIQSFFPTGATLQSASGTAAYADNEDWYVAPRPAGAFTVTLTNVPADCRGRLSVEGIPSGFSSGSQLGTVDGALGAPVTFSGTLAVAGKVRVRVTDFAPRILNGTTAPGAFTQKYTLLIGN